MRFIFQQLFVYHFHSENVPRSFFKDEIPLKNNKFFHENKTSVILPGFNKK